MSHQQLTQTTPTVPAEAQPVLPFIAKSHRNALERLGRTFTAAQPLAILIGRGRSATSFVTRTFLDNIEGDVDVVQITEPSSDGNAAMREIVNALGFDSKDMSDADLDRLLVGQEPVTR